MMKHNKGVYVNERNSEDDAAVGNPGKQKQS